MLGVAQSDQETDFVPSVPKPKMKAVLMMPRPEKIRQEKKAVKKQKVL